MEIIFSADEIQTTARKILDEKPQKVMLFHGPMGSGKTTLIKALVQQLGVRDTVGSPTFSLVNEYQLPHQGKVFHFDMYRLKEEREALDFGIEEYLYSGHWCFIEWAEKIPHLLPETYSTLTLSVVEQGKRKLELKNSLTYPA